MARAKRIYLLIIKVNKLFSFFSSRCFLKEIENMYSVFLSSYRNTRKSLGELEKAVETLACGLCSHNISRSPKLPLVFLQLGRNTVHVHVFYLIDLNLQWDGTSKNISDTWLFGTTDSMGMAFPQSFQVLSSLDFVFECESTQSSSLFSSSTLRELNWKNLPLSFGNLLCFLLLPFLVALNFQNTTIVGNCAAHCFYLLLLL